MTLNRSYVAELEHLIVSTLLPVYTNYQTRMGARDKYEGINPELLKLIKKKKPVARLLQAKEKLV